MSNLDALESVFGSIPAQPPPSHAADYSVSDRYELRLRSLVSAEGGKYQRLLDGSHAYASDSEACMAVIDAMVARHFTDGEVLRTLEGTALLTARIERKGERHARLLCEREIAKARQAVTPFERDPGDSRPARVAREVPARVVRPVLQLPPRGERAAPPPIAMPMGDDFVSRYVRYASQRTDAPLEAHQLQALLILSALAGPNLRLPIATKRNGWSLCLWGMYVVNSTTGRKSTVIDMARDIITEVLGPDAILHWEGSPQGILQRLQDRDGLASVFARDELSGLMAQMNRAGGHMAGLPQLLIRAFDGNPLENIRTKKRRTQDGEKEDDTDRVQNPYLVLMTAAARNALVERCTIDNVIDGFLARFIVISGRAEMRQLPRGSAALEAEYHAIVGHARTFFEKAQCVSTVDFTDDVLEQHWQAQLAWQREIESSSRPEAAEPALTRLLEAAVRAGALRAIDYAHEGEQPCLTIGIFEEALKMAERWKQHMLDLVDELGSTTFMRDTEAIRGAIHGAPGGIAVRDLARRFRRVRQRDFEEMLAMLEEREEIEVVSVRAQRGRPARIAYAFGHAPAGV